MYLLEKEQKHPDIFCRSQLMKIIKVSGVWVSVCLWTGKQKKMAKLYSAFIV